MNRHSIVGRRLLTLQTVDSEERHCLHKVRASTNCPWSRAPSSTFHRWGRGAGWGLPGFPHLNAGSFSTSSRVSLHPRVSLEEAAPSYSLPLYVSCGWGRGRDRVVGFFYFSFSKILSCLHLGCPCWRVPGKHAHPLKGHHRAQGIPSPSSRGPAATGS